MTAVKEIKEKESLNFIEEIIEQDLNSGKHQIIHTRFPPEPNGYLHIGHAKSICLNFGIAQKYGGKTNLRFDDTNPTTESVEYVESIKRDVRWLGFDWEDREYYASDYFEQLYNMAVQLIKAGKAYVDDSTSEEMAALKGTPTVPGQPSPYRDRSVEENLDLFERMRNGEFSDGAKVLRAKIDITSPNMLLRDPVIYRIKHDHHHRTGDKWVIYPMYDFAHGQSDALEGITHSLCTLEFENHRPLYDWCIQELNIFPSRQIEFARLNVNYTITSKRKLLKLVQEGHVTGWDDPRMPTISGMRRRGYTPAAIRNFCDRIGIAKRENSIDISLLEFFVREDLNKIATRVMVVIDPVKLIITNYPDQQTENMSIENNPEDEQSGHREVPFSKELYIEYEDFMEEPPKKFFRLGPGLSVRLKGAYIVTCDSFEKDSKTGKITAIHCTYHPNSKSGEDTSGMKVKGTIHWVSVKDAVPVEVRMYDRLFTEENPGGHEDKDYLEFINPDSLKIIKKAFAEPSLAKTKVGAYYQFLRLGYFVTDLDSKGRKKKVFNRTVTLKDTWAKEQKK
ncbi:MAG: glutamine--tRNA ligase/YqeY domain fusion protein [Saprospiraceae bacterium]|nr:glutamine--tRNA ligase/YqeY domain fusion protein [Saprospiraceae bacterium]